jgi:hypothetical protein
MKRDENMIVTKDKNRVVVEVSAEELRRHNLSYSLLDCRDVHTRNTIKRLLLEATGEVSSKAQEICLLPSSEEGCVIVFEEKAKENSVFFSFTLSESEVFSSFFS